VEPGSFSPMRRLVAPLVLPLLLLLTSCGGDDAENTGQATPAPETAVTTTPPSADEICQQLGVAIGADEAVERQQAFGQLHQSLATADAEVHEALFTLESQLNETDDGEALAAAMVTINEELGCGG
jgi:hypothetical protein